MNKKMNAMLSMLAVAVICLFASCAKDGATGPAGPTGSSGNANVKLIEFGADTLNALNSYVETIVFSAPVTADMLDSSLVLVYTLNSGNWYFAPGLGLNDAYQARVYTTGIVMYVKLQNPDGSSYSGGDQIFDETRVIIAPASVYKGSRMSADLRDYKTALKYFHLKDTN